MHTPTQPQPRALQHRHSVAGGLARDPPFAQNPPLSRSATYLSQPTAPPSPAPPFLHHNSEGTHPYVQAGPSAGFPAPSPYAARPANGLIPLQEAVALNRERTIRAQQGVVASGSGHTADSLRAASGSPGSPRGEGGAPKKLFRKRTSAPGSAPISPPVPAHSQSPAIAPSYYASYTPSSYYPDRRPPPSPYSPAPPHQPTSLPASPISPHTFAYPAYPSTASLPHLPLLTSPRTPEEIESEQVIPVLRTRLFP